MKSFRFVFLIASACTLILFSCKKEEVTHGPSPVHITGNPAVAAISLNGGNVSGRWTMKFEQFLTYRNDTLWDTDTLTYSPGELVLNFFSNGNMELMDGFDTVAGTYSTSGNQITLFIDQDVVVFTYGVQNSRMRWRIIESYTNGGDFYRDEADYLFERY
jgi:hypothetical protein